MWSRKTGSVVAFLLDYEETTSSPHFSSGIVERAKREFSLLQGGINIYPPWSTFLCVRWSHAPQDSSTRCQKKVVGFATGNVEIEYVKAASPTFLSLLVQVNGTQCAYRSASPQRCYKEIMHTWTKGIQKLTC